jgi:alpha-D-ribose 1-methylphosphonate 5-triphosphate synthase subunit PhnG
MAVLARADVEALAAALDALASPSYQRARGPETGLAMVRARAGGTGERFNVGEMTVSRCTVALANGLVGHAYVAGSDLRHAELAAVCDALLQDAAHREALERMLVEPLARTLAARREQAAARAAATRVEFFTVVRSEG